MREPLLIVSADDFGLTRGLCEAIPARRQVRDRHEHLGARQRIGALARAPSLHDSGLGAGAQFALVGHQGAVLSAREVPTLIDKPGQLAAVEVFSHALATKDFQGMGRYMLGAFPLFAVAGALLAERPRLRGPVFGASGALLAFGAFGFARHWYLT